MSPTGNDVEGLEGTAESDSPFGVASWRALGTYVQLVVADRERLPAAEAEAVRLLGEMDLAASRFRDDSDLIRANRSAGSWVKVRPLLVQAVQTAVSAAEETDGLVDPTLGNSLASVGYDRDITQVKAGLGPSAIPLPAIPDAWRQIELDPEGAIRVPDGVALDLGATGKAFCADLIARRISQEIGTSLVISLGGDVSVGSTDPDDPDPIPWQVAIGELPDGESDETVILERGGMATSSTVARRWKRDGHEVHHLLDPRTGRPVERSWRTVTVAATSCVAANTASTASLVLGEQAPAWLEARNLAARLVSIDGETVRLGGWPEESA